MSSTSLKVWCNAHFPPAASELLRQRLAGHTLILAGGLLKSNLVAGGADPALADADVALGQPDPRQAMELPGLKWVQLTTAGYTRYDRADLRQAFVQRGAIMTNSSAVYAEPCAEHVFAMMLAMARRLPDMLAEQLSTRGWRSADHRGRSRLLRGQRVLVLSHGSIARRLIELLGPLQMQIVAVRRGAGGEENGVRIVSAAEADAWIGWADHVVNILPASPSTEGFFDARRLAMMSPRAIFYNIGRGTTVDQAALLAMLGERRIAGAYLDVTDPEPLPVDHPLWTAPNCFITPHTAGGHEDEFERIVGHFSDNLDRFLSGAALVDRIV